MTNETCMAARCNKSAMRGSTLCKEHYDALPAPMRGEQPSSKKLVAKFKRGDVVRWNAPALHGDRRDGWTVEGLDVAESLLPIYRVRKGREIGSAVQIDLEVVASISPNPPAREWTALIASWREIASDFIESSSKGRGIAVQEAITLLEECLPFLAEHETPGECIARYSTDPETDWQRIARERTADLGKADEKIERLLTALNAKQARIDALMLEFCPGEMSAEQRAEWAKSQRVAHEAPAQSANALAPCPFCGTVPDDEPPVCTVEVDGKDGAQIGCSQCDAQGPAAIDEEGARASWNLRPSDEPEPALRPDGMPEPSLEVLKRVAVRMRVSAPDTAYLAEWAVEQIEEQTASFDLRWNADMRAIKRWQEAHPGNDLTWPDHADMVVWLLEQFDARAAQPPGTAHRVRLLKDIYDDGQDHYPPCYPGKKGDVVNVRSLYTIGVAHEGVTDSEFVVRAGEFEPVAAPALPPEPVPESFRQEVMNAAVSGLRNLLELATNHIDMESLRISHCKDWALLVPFIAKPSSAQTKEERR